MLDFIFFNIIYPIFRIQINKILDQYRLAQVRSVDNTPNGLVYIELTKCYEPETKLLIYSATTHIFDPDDPEEFLGSLEEVAGTARVVSKHSGCSRAVVTRMNRSLRAGLLVKAIDSKEFAFRSFKKY